MTFWKKWFWSFLILLVPLLVISFVGELAGHPFKQSSSEAILPAWISWSFNYAVLIAFAFSMAVEAFQIAREFKRALVDEIVERVIEGVMERLEQRD